jgi:DNA-binding NarL/FixJ family response regulator
LAQVAHEEGDYTAVLALYEESLAIFRSLGAGSEITAALRELGRLAVDQGDHGSALSHYREALAVASELGYPAQVAAALEGYATVDAARGQLRRALELAAAASAWRNEVQSPLTPTDSARLDRVLESARRELGRRASEEAWAVGRAIPIDEAIAIALREDEPADQRTLAAIACALEGPSEVATAVGPTADDSGRARLTRREREVVALVARGLTNRQIAEQLLVSERTAEWHVANSLGKLGLHSRAQLVVWASRHDVPVAGDPSGTSAEKARTSTGDRSRLTR